ncbi:hypothetical protein Bpfe_012700 [Biomphalaria pfeifferi]|uniref:Uncharacterized protein n=1 Tax=Biomphalaria pfeifferi TaxID=112525 RepID=A0AAD8BNR0_BIOPF|nr:hypothetical protein Bpfe_012700 [Biomphalaria pfeifferi]
MTTAPKQHQNNGAKTSCFGVIQPPVGVVRPPVGVIQPPVGVIQPPSIFLLIFPNEAAEDQTQIIIFFGGTEHFPISPKRMEAGREREATHKVVMDRAKRGDELPPLYTQVHKTIEVPETVFCLSPRYISGDFLFSVAAALHRTA